MPNGTKDFSMLISDFSLANRACQRSLKLYIQEEREVIRAQDLDGDIAVRECALIS